jgi:hypothetical protein
MDRARNSEGGMNQGAKRHALSERGNDLYETPACAIRTLIKAEKLPHVIWEPCAGKGAISRELIVAGHVVQASDLVAYDGADFGIYSGRDFLFERAPPRGCRTIVTNPPFKLADKFVRHGISLGCDVIVLLRLMAIEGSGRSDIVDSHLVKILAGVERLPMMHRDGWTGRKIGSSGAPFAWFKFTATPRQSPAIELQRVSWRSEAKPQLVLTGD